MNSYRTNIRALVVADNDRVSLAGANDIRKSFNVPDKIPGHRGRRAELPHGVRQSRLFMFEHRLPGVFNKYASLLSAAEVASIYPLPNSETSLQCRCEQVLS